MAVIFPDLDALLVTHLKDVLGEVYVATKRAEPDDEQELQVVITASYNQTLDYVRRQASAVIDCYAQDEITASQLAHFVAATVVTVAGAQIKFAEVNLGPLRQADEAPLEKQSMTVDFIVKGSTL